MPFDADMVAVPPSAPLAGLVPIASVIDTLLPVIVLPPASCTGTTGCVVQTAPPVQPLGCVANASFVAEPTETLNALLVAPASRSDAAVSVYPLPALLMDRALNVATPLTALTVVVP